MATTDPDTVARLRAHAVLLEMLLAYEIRQAAHVAMADPAEIARNLADRFAKTIQHTDEAVLAGPGAPSSAADRSAMVEAVKREIDRIIDGTISRLAKPAAGKLTP